MFKVRLLGLREMRIAEPLEDEVYRRQLIAYEALPSPRPPFNVDPPKGKLTLMAHLELDRGLAGGFGYEFCMQCPVEALPDGARIGDEFELQFVKVRK